MKYRLNRVSVRRFQLLSILLLVFFCSNSWSQVGSAEKEKKEPAGSGTTEERSGEKTGAAVEKNELKEKFENKKVIEDDKINSGKPEKTPVKRDVKKTEKKTAVKEKAAAKPVKKPEGPEPSEEKGAILYIKDGAFRYRRIPGYKDENIDSRTGENRVKEDEIVRIPDRIEIDETEVKAEGIFGFSRETTDLVVKIILGVMIFFIFVLYRIRTRKRSSGVLRRYPNR